MKSLRRKESYKVEEYPHRFSGSSPEIKRRSPESKIQDVLRNEDLDINSSLSRKWPTSWFWQFLVLTVRTFRQSRHVILSKLNFIQTILISVVASLIWFQIPEDEESINDRQGYVSDESTSLCKLGVMLLCVSAVFLHHHFLGLSAVDSCYHVT